MELTQKDIELVQETLKDIGFLQHLSPVEMDQLIKGFEKVAIRKGEVIIKQGNPGSIFYLLSRGSVGIYRQRAILDKQITVLHAASLFGEMALLDSKPRTASVICESDGVVFTLLHKTFRDVLLRNTPIADLLRKLAKHREEATRQIEMNEKMGKLGNQS